MQLVEVLQTLVQLASRIEDKQFMLELLNSSGGSFLSQMYKSKLLQHITDSSGHGEKKCCQMEVLKT